jgi:hypothetical protein
VCVVHTDICKELHANAESSLTSFYVFYAQWFIFPNQGPSEKVCLTHASDTRAWGMPHVRLWAQLPPGVLQNLREEMVWAKLTCANLCFMCASCRSALFCKDIWNTPSSLISRIGTGKWLRRPYDRWRIRRCKRHAQRALSVAVSAPRMGRIGREL